MLTILYVAPACFGAIIMPSSGNWYQNFLKKYSNEICHDKHTQLSFATTVSQLKICDFSGETFKGFEVL